ncbi:hypothetical protein C8F04DRAFT_1390777 [Mycena alexandri]|uniref:Ubiquitin-like protease family profile domain-containing protein n=1 Tax=Mycena alexandri TaxID=1745969 RepID=A0AAD6TDC4_9AGAR|nr:hypothetical protein C8F04DRAFT_1390777 [Mycena alexandri]
MDPRLSEAAAVLKSGVYAIRDMQLAASDLQALDPASKTMVPGTLLNVAAALLQAVSERDGTGDFAVFSTWLSPLISKKVEQGSGYGTIAGHIRDAGDKEMLLAKARWLFPLFWAARRHWLLGWIDLAASEIHIFDGMPELQSYMWAEPALVELAETVFTTLGREINLEPWPVIKHSPSELHRQMDGHSCGFFAIYGIRVIGNGEDLASVTQSQMPTARRQTLDLICQNFALLAPKPKLLPLPSVDTDVVMTPLNETNADAFPARIPEPLLTQVVPPEVSDPVLLVNATEPAVQSSSKRKLDKAPESSSQPAEKKKKGPYKKTEDRKKVLDANPHISAVEPHRVRCNKCSEWIALDPKSKYKLANWEAHEGRCSAITGKKYVRTRVQKTHKIVTGSGAISSFFGGAGSNTGASTSKAAMDSALDSDSDNDSKAPKTSYVLRIVNATPSAINFFDPGPIKNPPPKPVILKEPKPCRHLSGGRTRSLGGVSPVFRGRLIRQILFYKKFAPLKSKPQTAESIRRLELSIPTEGNACMASPDWTAAEHEQVDVALKAFARWDVDPATKTVRSSRCEGVTRNDDNICDACRKVAKDESLVHAVLMKNTEAKLPLEEQHQIFANRDKYSNRHVQAIEARKLDSLFKDPIAFKAFKTLEKGRPTECFLQLYEATLNGKLKGYETLKEICTVAAETIRRTDEKTLSGIRYPAHYLNFAILMRSYGGNSARQFGILAGEIPLPSMRHIRALVPKSADALQNPYLIFENMARVKRLVDSINYRGPVAVAGDCTKVRKRLAYSNDFGGHILGSVWELEDCIAEDPADIERVIGEIAREKAQASQVRAILVKVPLPQIHPLVVALLPTNGDDDAAKIFEQQMKLLKMAAELSLPVVSFAADGAASELAAQKLMDNVETSFPPITYDNPTYGIHIKVPVLSTGPVVSAQDPGHAKKTGRNGLQSGTRTEDLGEDVVVNNTLVKLQKNPKSGLLPSDVGGKMDKQDDGPARHLFHYKALCACTTGEGEAAKIEEGFGGLFVYLFVLGVLFDAWLNRTMTVANRVLAVLRARFFLHIWRAHILRMSAEYPDLYSIARSFITTPSFHIFNRLCDSLLSLVIIYARRYPNQPFCPWLHGTEFVEHFFGLARMMLPNFTWAEFIKLVQHVMVRQRILLSGSFKEKRERNARLGYVLDFDPSPLTAEDRRLAEVTLTNTDMDALVKIAFTEASLICTQLLHIRAPKPTLHKPLDLAPLGAPMPKVKPSAGQNSDSADEDEDDYSDDEEPNDGPDPEPFCGVTNSEEVRTIALATHDAARYSALCEDFEEAVKELESLPVVPVVSFGPEAPPVLAVATVSRGLPTPLKSELIDTTGKLSIPMMLQARLHWQAGTTTKSEKVLQIDSKYALSRIERAARQSSGDNTEPEKMTLQEASNLTRVVQDRNVILQESKPVKYREVRWKGIVTAVSRLVNAEVLPNIAAKNVQPLNPLTVGYMAIMWNGTRFYIGEILDVYKKGASSRHGSVPSPSSVSGLSFMSLRVYLPLIAGGEESDEDSDEEDSDDIAAPLFSCHYKNYAIRLHTHAKIDHLLFNLGPHIFEEVEAGARHRTLKPHAALCWTSLTKRGEVSKEVKKVTLRLPKHTAS